MNNDNRELIPVEGNAGEMIVKPPKYALQEKGWLVSSFYTSLPAESKKDRLALFNAMNDEQLTSEYVINTEVDVVDVTIFPQSKINKETGELEEWAGVLLHLDDGRTVRFGSKGVYGSLRLFFGAGFCPPYDPPITFKVVQQKAKEGPGSILKLRYIGEKSPSEVPKDDSGT